jgi:SAM-dependent methyltransferase
MYNPFERESLALNYDEVLKKPIIRQIRREEGKIIFKIFDEKLKKDDNVLEIGSGTGYYTLTLASRVNHLTALEPSKHMAGLLREKIDKNKIRNVNVKEMYFEHYKPDSEFDHVFSAGVLDYIQEPEMFIKHCLLLARKSFIFTIPQRGLWGSVYKYGARINKIGVYTWSGQDIERTAAGFSLEFNEAGLKTFLTKGLNMIFAASAPG